MGERESEKSDDWKAGHLQNQGSNRDLCMKFRIESTDSMCALLIMYDFRIHLVVSCRFSML